MPLVFAATQVTLIVRSAHSAKLLLFAAVVIVNLGHTQDREEWRRVYAQDELNAPSPLLPQSSVQNRGEEHILQSRRTVYAARVGGSTFICKTCIHMMHCTEVLPIAI